MKNLVMIGGGVDSAVVLGILCHSGLQVEGLHIDLGNSKKQREAAEKLCDNYKVNLEVIEFDIKKLWKPSEDSKMWPFYCGYGQLMMTIAYAYADRKDCGVVYTGEYDILDESSKSSLDVPEAERWNFSKKRLIWDSNLWAYHDVMQVYKKLYSLDRMMVCHPLAGFDQVNVVALGKMLGVPFHLTNSCSNGDVPKHCGKCVKCEERIAAFDKAGVSWIREPQ